MEAAWIFTPRRRRNPRVRLLCFPHAGGGSQQFAAWADDLPPDVELCAVRLPGRESRINEPPYSDIQPLISAVANGLARVLEQPFMLFGHSMGALVAFELARFVAQRGRCPLLLCVSAMAAPQCTFVGRLIHALPDDEFIAALRDLGGTPPEVLRHRELMELLLPTLRADFRLLETYEYVGMPPLRCPILALGGDADPTVPLNELSAWREQTASWFRQLVFPGNHFYLLDPQVGIPRILLEALTDGRPASMPSIG